MIATPLGVFRELSHDLERRGVRPGFLTILKRLSYSEGNFIRNVRQIFTCGWLGVAFGPEGEAHSARPRPAHLNLCEKDGLKKAGANNAEATLGAAGCKNKTSASPGLVPGWRRDRHGGG